mgnify:CR=1 FL=1
MGKFFNVNLNPDVVASDISSHIATNKTNTDIAANDIIFDWHAIDVPSGSCMLRSISAIVNAEDGAYGAGSLTDYELIFAKSVDGSAPPSIGISGSTGQLCFALRSHYVGSIMLDSIITKATLTNLGFHVAYVAGENPSQDFNVGLPLVMDLEPGSGTNVGYDKLYVCAFQMAGRHYGTECDVNQSAYDASEADPAVNTIVCDGVDARKIFSIGDTVYIHDLDTPIPGTLTKVEALKLTFSETNSTVDIADGDELFNANPIRIKLGFEK